jgi:hypothetical protein
VFKTEYFQFQTDKKWTFMPKESTSTKFIYRKYNKTLLEHQLTIKVNNDEPLIESTHVLPATITTNGTFQLKALSDHCKTAKSIDKTKNPVQVVHAKVNMMCKWDSSNFVAVVGLEGGSSKLTMKRTNGQIANYTITYNNVKFSPDGSELMQLLESFQTR